MPTEILMPALSPTMTEGLARWLKAEGDPVAAGEAIAEIETDKATMEIEAIDEGTLGKILVAEGAEGIAVNTPIALFLAEGEDASAAPAGGAARRATGGQDRRRRRGRAARRRRWRSPASAMAPRRSRRRSRQAPRWSNNRARGAARPPWPRRCGAIRTSS